MTKTYGILLEVTVDPDFQLDRKAPTLEEVLEDVETVHCWGL